MKPDDLEPLSDAMRSLLDSERPLQPVPGDVKARLFERLSTSIANVPGGSGSSGSGSGSAPRGDGGAGSVGSGTAGAAKLAPGALGGAATAGKVVIGIVSFSLGGVVGAGIHAAATSNERPAMVAASQPSVSPAAPAAGPLMPGAPTGQADPGATGQPGAAAPSVSVTPEAPGGAPPINSPSPVGAPVSGSSRPAAGARGPTASPGPNPAAQVAPAQPRPGDSLGAERSLVDQARAALARHDTAAALAALAQHQQAFPSGQLAEERLALQVMAMAQSGQLDRARELAQLFRAQHPDSLLLPAVEASVRGAGP